MCFKHWRLVPRELQLPVLEAYRARPATAETPSVDWCQAADAAVAFVAQKERRKVKQTFTETFHPKVQPKASVDPGPRTRVVNMRDEPYDEFIGRPGKDLDGPFGNPFRSGPVLARFREYFLERVERDADFRAQVLALRGRGYRFAIPRSNEG